MLSTIALLAWASPALQRQARALKPFRTGALVLCMLVVACGRTDAPREASHPPNIVLIFADDLGYDDIGCYWTPYDEPGYERIDTPNIDRMAREGIRFTSFCVGDSICTPSRAALLTGCYPARNGMSFPPEHHGVLRAQSKEGLSLEEVTIAELLQDKGYATICIGKWHLGNRVDFLPTRQGFDEYFGPVSRGKAQPAAMLRGEEHAGVVDHRDITERYTRETIRFMEENRDRPFFIYLSHGMPHVPLGASAAFRGKSPRGIYGDAVMELDWSTGEVLKALERLDLDERTLVVFTSDNGPALALGDQAGKAHPLRKGKSSSYEGGFRVPCVIRWPGEIPPDSVCDELVTAMDFLPTFCRVAGQQVPDDRVIDGVDIGDLMRAVPGARSPHESFGYYRRSQLQAIRSGPWKLHFDPRGIPAALYNLELDIAESRDVSAENSDVMWRLDGLANVMRADLGDAYTGVDGSGRRALGYSESARLRRSADD